MGQVQPIITFDSDLEGFSTPTGVSFYSADGSDLAGNSDPGSMKYEETLNPYAFVFRTSVKSGIQWADLGVPKNAQVTSVEADVRMKLHAWDGDAYVQCEAKVIITDANDAILCRPGRWVDVAGNYLYGNGWVTLNGNHADNDLATPSPQSTNIKIKILLDVHNTHTVNKADFGILIDSLRLTIDYT